MVVAVLILKKGVQSCMFSFKYDVYMTVLIGHDWSLYLSCRQFHAQSHDYRMNGEKNEPFADVLYGYFNKSTLTFAMDQCLIVLYSFVVP